MSTSNICKNIVTVSVDVSDKLTSVSCGHIVVELIKFIAYQRLQIPYTYQWLKQVVNKRKLGPDNAGRGNIQSERHYRIASTALDNLDFILKSLLQEISGPTMPDEVCVTLGATPVTCKEVYRVLLPGMCHKPQCQSSQIIKDQKLQTLVFRQLVTSEELSETFTTPLPPTNMHVFIRKKSLKALDEILNGDNFLPASGSRIPRSCKVINIDFRNPITNMACCNQFQIFGESDLSQDLLNLQIKECLDDDFSEIQSSDANKWFQSTYVMKGFKDCLINGSSVTNTWLESS